MTRNVALLLAVGGALALSMGAAAQGMPPGHPPTNQAGDDDLQNAMLGPLPDRSHPDPTLPARSITVEVRDERGQPLRNIEVSLITMFSSIAQGDSKASQRAVTGPSGEVHFTDLDTALRFTYAIQVTREGARYGAEPFRLGQTGHRVILHTYPVTSDMRDGFVGVQVLASIGLREGHFDIQSVYRVLPLNRKTFAPKNLAWSIPDGAQAVDLGEQPGDGKVEVKDGKIHLLGTYPPGQNQVGFTYQIPHKNSEFQLIDFGLPPHVTNFVIVVEKTPTMGLSIPGFEIIESKDQGGKDLLVARKTMHAGEAQLTHLPVELSGLPTIGPGRWYASGLALLLTAGGMGLALSRRNRGPGESERDRRQARDVLLDEMVLLETAFAREEIGPHTYEQTKREILLALSRLDDVTA